MMGPVLGSKASGSVSGSDVMPGEGRDGQQGSTGSVGGQVMQGSQLVINRKGTQSHIVTFTGI